MHTKAFREDLAQRAGQSNAEHDSAQRLVAKLSRYNLDNVILGMTGAEFIRNTASMDNTGRPRDVRVIVRPKVDYGWVGPPPWDPKKWAADRAALRGEG